MTQIWIEWGGRTYGPYPSPDAALAVGFHLPDACLCKGCVAKREGAA
jgi:hypothetical protein